MDYATNLPCLSSLNPVQQNNNGIQEGGDERRNWATKEELDLRRTVERNKPVMFWSPRR